MDVTVDVPIDSPAATHPRALARGSTGPSSVGAIVSLVDVFRIYREGEIETVALRGVDLRVEAGEFVAIMGRSGSGKTTLLNLIAGMDRPTAGQVVVASVDMARGDDAARGAIRGRRVGLVFQDQNLVPMLTLRENLVLFGHLAGRALDISEADRRLDAVGLTGREKHRPDELSGGEQQRAALACALVADPPLLLGDEITGELDTATATTVLDLVARMNAAGTTVVLVTHDPAVAARAGRVVELHDGRVVADRSAT